MCATSEIDQRTYAVVNVNAFRDVATLAFTRVTGSFDGEEVTDRLTRQFFNEGRKDGGNFDAGVQFALERMLVDPDFLLRVIRDPAKPSGAGPQRLSDLELASRLSFFLWSSIPDDRLLTAAERG
ncbi:MAG TPA: DUF1592 domain-containing protein, partial [Steroidobacteraceae bacterium]|nr:DUF1592 domain-containing protein [Steroidobacteraceae bacterium]